MTSSQSRGDTDTDAGQSSAPGSSVVSGEARRIVATARRAHTRLSFETLPSDFALALRGRLAASLHDARESLTPSHGTPDV